MASEQMRRENVSDERSIEVERDKVPKMATHFESLAEKAKEGLSLRPQGERAEQYETRVTPSQVKGRDEEKGERAHHEVTGQRVGSEMLTGEEERGGKDQETKHQVVGGESEERESPNLEEISSLRQTAQQKSIDAVNAAQERYERAKAAAGEALKGATVEKGQQAKDLTAQKAAEAKDVISSKVEAVKDTTVETGKGAAGYAEKVKDRAVVAGWGATHYTLEKVAEATKAVAGATSSVAGYTGEKGGAVKEKVVEKIAAAKDAVVGMEEKVAEMAARKKAEAEKGLEEKGEAHAEGKVEVGKGGEEHHQETEQPEQEEEENRVQVQEEAGGGVLQAIGETIVEIGQTTKDILAGQYPAHVLEPKEEEEKD